jgi:hypothetical protein
MTGRGRGPSHKFKVGQLVTVTHSILKRRIGGSYEIVALVPDDGPGLVTGSKVPTKILCAPLWKRIDRCA